MRTICVVTGSRSEYGLLRPIMRRIQATTGLELRVVATGMHLSNEFGRTERVIEQDGFRIDARVDMLFSQDTTAAMASGIAVGIQGFVHCLPLIHPDIVLLLGDRVEPFAAAIAAGFLRIPIAHVHGGDKGRGGFDEPMRATITRFAHLHFPATELSRQRILRSGEREEYVFTVGAPGLDEAVGVPLMSRAEIDAAFGLVPGRELLLVVQHPVSTEPEHAAAQMRETMEAIRSIARQTVVLYPNSDAGGRAMIEVIREYAGLPFVRVFDNLDHRQYLSLLSTAAVLVGNSSSGMIESPYFKTAVVNVGRRQEGRERSTNVLDVPHERDAIVAAVHTALEDRAFKERVRTCENPYGDGKASERIVDVLGTVPLDDRLLQKEDRPHE